MEKAEKVDIHYPDGRVDSGVKISMVIPHREKMKEAFIMLFQHIEIEDRLFCDPDITDKTRTVFFRLLLDVDYDNRLVIHQARLARRLGISPNTMSVIIRRLLDKGLILRTREDARNLFQIDPRLAFKGRASHLNKAREQLNAA